VVELGGSIVGEVDNVGPGRALTCQDDQGTVFRIASWG
jgi:hypothetical protein